MRTWNERLREWQGEGKVVPRINEHGDLVNEQGQIVNDAGETEKQAKAAGTLNPQEAQAAREKRAAEFAANEEKIKTTQGARGKAPEARPEARPEAKASGEVAPDPHGPNPHVVPEPPKPQEPPKPWHP